MTGRVEVDTSRLVRAVAGIGRGIGRNGPAAARATATAVASELRAGVPFRTGRLRGSVTVVRNADGAAVSYGAGVPYAAYIDSRTGAVSSAVSGSGRTFTRACEQVAATEVRRNT
jgi:hypothetical protein